MYGPLPEVVGEDMVHVRRAFGYHDGCNGLIINPSIGMRQMVQYNLFKNAGIEDRKRNRHAPHHIGRIITYLESVGIKLDG